MCFRGCQHENWQGECCKSKNTVCPCELEDYENDKDEESE